MTADHRRTKVTQAALGPSSVLTRLDTSTCRVVVTNTLSKGKSVELSGDESVVMGADDDCGLQIEDPTVSGQHAKLTRTDGGALIVDLGSTNGTFYQRSRVREVVVPYGATISLGKAEVKVVPHENAVLIPQSETARFGDLVGEDRRMREMFSLLGDVAPTDATVVIEGETGTGKELVAKALHDHSERAKKHFVVFDCSAVPHDLVESALFGHPERSHRRAVLAGPTHRDHTRHVPGPPRPLGLRQGAARGVRRVPTPARGLRFARPEPLEPPTGLASWSRRRRRRPDVRPAAHLHAALPGRPRRQRLAVPRQLLGVGIQQHRGGSELLLVRGQGGDGGDRSAGTRLPGVHGRRDPAGRVRAGRLATSGQGQRQDRDPHPQ